MTECTKVKYASEDVALSLIPALERKYGHGFEVYPCREGCKGIFHHRSKKTWPSRPSKERPDRSRGKVSSRRRRVSRWHYRTARLPVEVWEGEGGSMHPWEVLHWYGKVEPGQ